MAHYALLDENNVVVDVITGRDEDEVVDGISDWEAYYAEFHGMTCKRTSYNTFGNQHAYDGTPFRFNYAVIGGSFDESVGTDGAFIPPKHYASWVLNPTTQQWESPVPHPTATSEDPNPLKYVWVEDLLEWVNVEERPELFPVQDGTEENTY